MALSPYFVFFLKWLWIDGSGGAYGRDGILVAFPENFVYKFVVVEKKVENKNCLV